VLITSEPFTGARFRSASSAANALAHRLTPERSDGPLNGWTFWRVGGPDGPPLAVILADATERGGRSGWAT
jgi:hypothetical protein